MEKRDLQTMPISYPKRPRVWVDRTHTSGRRAWLGSASVGGGRGKMLLSHSRGTGSLKRMLLRRALASVGGSCTQPTVQASARGSRLRQLWALRALDQRSPSSQSRSRKTGKAAFKTTWARNRGAQGQALRDFAEINAWSLLKHETLASLQTQNGCEHCYVHNNNVPLKMKGHEHLPTKQEH